MQSDSNKGDNELQLLRKQMADEKLKKEQVKDFILNCALLLF